MVQSLLLRLTLRLNYKLLFSQEASDMEWGEKRNAYRILVGMPEGKRPLGRPRRRWVYNIKIDYREIGWNGMD
jgi:hypothetical protein